LPSGLATTVETLAASRNDAANAVLQAALASSDTAVYEGAMKAIISRRNKAGHLAILTRWHQLAPHQREFLQEGRGRISGALRDAVLTDDPQLFANACELIAHFTEFDIVPTLVTLAENQKNKHARPATDLVLHLVEELSAMLHQPRDYTDRRDPQAIARFVLESLERSVERFQTHKRTELIEAFVVLGGPTSAALGEILEDPRHPCYPTVIHTLATSASAGVMEFLLRSLRCERTSLNILKVISKRTDPKFVGELLRLADGEIPKPVVKNLKRIRSFQWLQPGDAGYASFADEDQARCIDIVSASGVKSDVFLDLLESILKRGEPTARWKACDALAAISGDRGNQLILDAVNDADPKVQAAATRQVRDRHVPGAMGLLLKQIDSPHEVVRAAARGALSEFSFENFLVGFDSLHDDARRTTGSLVKKVDPDTTAGLLAEMQSPSRKRRLRAIEMADSMELVPAVSAGLLQLLEEDKDHLVRAAVSDVLQFCPTAEVQAALRVAANDRSAAVQNAAKNSLAVFDDLGRELGPTVTAGAS